jgi:hypothetical protein
VAHAAHALLAIVAIIYQTQFEISTPTKKSLNTLCHKLDKDIIKENYQEQFQKTSLLITMETIIPINNESSTRHRHHHSRHHSMGTVSLASLGFEEDAEELQQQPPGHSRKTSLPDISWNLAWSVSNDWSIGADAEEDAEDDREDARQRLLSEDGTSGRERLLSEDGSTYELDSKLPFSNTINNNNETIRYSEQEDDNFLLSEDIGFEVELYEEPRQVQVQVQELPCFRGIIASCPDMPSIDRELLQEDSERLDLLLRRTRAFTEDNSDVFIRRRTSMSNMDMSSSSVVGVRVRSYGRQDSMLIDSKESVTESPTSTWLYWEANLDSAAPVATSSPYADAFRVPQQF